MSVAARAATFGVGKRDYLTGLLTWKRARNYAVLVGLLYVAAWFYFSFSGTAPLNRLGEPLGGDYIAFHTAGRMLLDGQAGLLYDAATVRAVEARSTLQEIPALYDPLRNPPFFALVFVPFATLDLVPSYAAWSLVSIACLATAIWLLLGMVGLRDRWRAVACIVFGFAPVYLGLVGGQNSSVALLLYVLIYRALSRGRYGAAGAWAALGLFKPQLFLLFPLLFLVTRRWRALGTYCTVAAVLGLVSIVIVGPDGVVSWVHILFSNNLEAGIALKQGFRMHSLKSFFDLLLPTNAAFALALSVVVSLALAVTLVRLAASTSAWRPASLPWLYALICVLGVLVDPHIFDYDLAILLCSAILIGTLDHAARWWFLGFYALMFLREPIPVGDVYVQLSVPALVVFAWWLWRRLLALSAVSTTPAAA